MEPLDLLRRPETHDNGSRLGRADAARRVTGTRPPAVCRRRRRRSGAANAAALALRLPTTGICHPHRGVRAEDPASCRIVGPDLAPTFEALNHRFQVRLPARGGPWLTDSRMPTEAPIPVGVLRSNFPSVSPTQGR